MEKNYFLSGIFGFAAIASVNASIPSAEAAILVSNTRGNNIVSFDEVTGNFLGEFITADRGLIDPDTIVYGPDGNIYVSSGTTLENSAILRFDGKTGAFIDRFASGNGLYRPYGMAFGPDGNLYVSSFLSDEILRYDSKTGQFVDTFARGTAIADGLNGPNGLLFGPDGFLYATTQGSVAENGVPNYQFESQVLRYNPATGEGQVFARQPAPSPDSFGFVSFLGLAINPKDGDLYVSDFANSIRRYDLLTGLLEGAISTNYTGTQPSNNFIGSLAFGPDGNLFTVGFDFTQNNIGSILRYDSSGLPLPLAGNFGALFVANSDRLQRPIGIAFTPPVDVPEPGMAWGLMLAAIAPVGVRTARSLHRKRSI